MHAPQQCSRQREQYLGSITRNSTWSHHVSASSLNATRSRQNTCLEPARHSDLCCVSKRKSIHGGTQPIIRQRQFEPKVAEQERLGETPLRSLVVKVDHWLALDSDDAVGLGCLREEGVR